MRKTRSIQVYKIDTLSGDNKEPRKYTYSEFDLKQNLLKEIHFNTEEEPEQVAEYRYGDEGYLIEEKLFDDEMEVIEWKTYERDSEGRITHEFQHFQDGSHDTVVYSYDDSNRLTELKKTDSDGFVETIEQYVYENDLLIDNTVTGEDGNIIDKLTYSYTDNNILERTEHITYDDGLAARVVSEYDENGNKIKSLRYNTKNQLVEKAQYAFDEKGKLLTMDEENQLRTMHLNLEYDSSENATLQQETDDAGGIISSVERVFDDENKVLETKVFMDGMGLRLDQDYVLKYDYTYFDDTTDA